MTKGNYNNIERINVFPRNSISLIPHLKEPPQIGSELGHQLNVSALCD